MQFLEDNKSSINYCETSVYYNDDYIYKEFSFFDLFETEENGSSCNNSEQYISFNDLQVENIQNLRMRSRSPDIAENEISRININRNEEYLFDRMYSKKMKSISVNNIAIPKESSLHFSKTEKYCNPVDKNINTIYYRAGVNVIIDYSLTVLRMKRKKKRIKESILYHYSETSDLFGRTVSVRLTDRKIGEGYSCNCFNVG